MHDEFFGHVLAGLRFGLRPETLLQAVDVAFEVAGTAATKKASHGSYNLSGMSWLEAKADSCPWP